jgi:anaerobic dimethyl sulfoxide reductase subunit C (anchor subunit)
MKTQQWQAPKLVPHSHEWPLVVFTTLAIMGAGLLTAPLLAWSVGQASLPADLARAAASRLLLPGTTLLAAGLLVSLAHLGQPRRAPLALAQAGRSRLSNEIVLASITLAAGAFASAFPYRSPVTALLPSIAAMAFLVSLGLVYALPGQLAWRGAVIASPLMLGLGFGIVALGSLSSWNPALAGSPTNGLVGIATIASIALAADVGLLLMRSVRVVRHTAAPSYSWLLAARFLLVDVLPLGLLLAGLPRGAAGFLGLGILVDRLAFYLFAVHQTTEAEIARVEAVIAGDREER